MEIPGGSTNVSIDVRAMTSAGAALTGKVAANFTLWYRRDGAKIPISLSNLGALTDAHSDGGMYEIGDGWYRLDVPDAAFATGANRAAFGGSVAGGVVVSAPITITTKSGYSLSATGADLVLVDGKTLPAALQIIAAGVMGEVSGAGSGTEVFVGLDAATTRATVTVDASGNRTTVEYA